MKIVILIIGFLISSLFFSCTENDRVTKYGGSMDISLDKNKKFVNCNWNDNHLWILTTEMEQNHTPRTYTFEEKSSLGVMGGKIVIKETK